MTFEERTKKKYADQAIVENRINLFIVSFISIALYEASQNTWWLSGLLITLGLIVFYGKKGLLKD